MPTNVRCYKHYLVGQWLWLSGRAVASDSRGPQFESSHWQTFKIHIFTANCIEKTKIKKKRPGIAHLKNKHCLEEI